MSSFFLYDSPLSDFDRLFNEAFNARVRHTPSELHGQAVQRRPNDAQAGVHVLRPKMDLLENKEANTVTATFELPGLTKENVDIDVHDGLLSISGERKISSEHDENEYTIHERRFGKFSRTLQLPRGVTTDQIKASLENGVLTVTFPRSTPEMASKQVSIA